MKSQSLLNNINARHLAVVVLVLTVSIAHANYKSAILADHPVGYWPLDLNVDTGSSATDVSGNGNNGTYVNISSTNKVSGPSAAIPNGVSFDGSSTYVNLGTPSALNFAGKITLEAWVQPTSSQSANPADILAKGWLNGGGFNEIEMSVASGDYHGGRDGGYYVDSGVASTNWTYVVCVCDKTNWTFYVNGQLVGMNADTTGVSQFSDSWAIGNGTDGGAGRIFKGNICQVAIYTNALTPLQILTHYSQAQVAYSSAILADHPVGYWPLDLSVDTGSSATDVSGNGNNGTYVNISSTNKVSGPSAAIPNGVSFNGSSTYVNLGAPSALNFAGKITLEAWVQPAGSQSANPADILAKGWLNGGGFNEIEMSVVSGHYRGGRDGGNYVDSGTAATNWTHVVYVCDKTNWTLYVNGQSVGTHADTTGVSQFSDSWAIGNGTDGGAGRIFKGNICQVAIYTNALTPAQIATHYSQVYAKGIAAIAPLIQYASTFGATWVYNWWTNIPSLPSGIEFVPMKWGSTYGETAADVSNWVASVKGAGAEEVLAFNEPDGAGKGQANLTVSQALQGYGYLYQGPLPVISPAAADDTDVWMQSFMTNAASQGYNIPAVAVHWYWYPASDFLGKIGAIHSLYGKPLWITEFAPSDWSGGFTGFGVDDCVAFINTALPALQSLPYVTRYSWYAGQYPGSGDLGTAALFNTDNTLTELGDRYRTPGAPFTVAGYTWRLVNRTSTNCLDNYGNITSGSGIFQFMQIPTTYQIAVLNDRPVGYWPLDLSKDTNTTAWDLSGNGNNGTYVNISSNYNIVVGPSGNIPNGVSFDGSSTYVNLGTPSALNFAGKITLEAWVQPASSQSANPADILAKGWLNGGGFNEIEMSVASGDYHGGRDGGYYADGGAASTNWTYVVCVCDKTNWTLYVNGQSVGTHADTTGVSQFSDSWAIGNGTDGGAGRIFKGNICQVAIYTNTLTPLQIAGHYAEAMFPAVTVTNQNQRWIITASGSHYKLQCVTGALYLDTLGNTTTGSLIGQVSRSSSNNQLWDIASVGSGLFKITSVASGLCLDSFGSITNGAAVGQSTSSSSSNQKWMLIGY